MEIERNNVRAILAVRNDRFGEFLLNIPALRALKQAYQNAKLIVITDPYVAELAKDIPFIDEVIAWGQNRSLLAKLRLIYLLRKKHIGLAVILNPSKEFNIISYLAGIPVRAGYDRKWGFLLTHKVKDEKYAGKRHEVEYNLELAGLIGAKSQDKGLLLNTDADMADRLLGDFNIDNSGCLIALHPWTSDPVKQWPKGNFKELARLLALEPGIKVVIVGGEEEAEKDRGFFSDCLSPNIINLAGKTTLLQLAALFKKCKLLVSGDSGPVHLACCVATPVIALFSNDIPGKSARRWGPWGAGNIVIEKNSLYDIKVEEVFNRIKEKVGKISHN